MEQEKINISIIDVLDASTFKIVQKNNIIVVFIKYPKLKGLGNHYLTRSNNVNGGKIIILSEIIKYKKIFYKSECKKELNHHYCKISKESSCLTNLLNKYKANCTKIKERNQPIEIINAGNIVLTRNSCTQILII